MQSETHPLGPRDGPAPPNEIAEIIPMLKFKYHRTLALALLVSALGASAVEAAYPLRPLFSNRYTNGPATPAQLGQSE